MDIVSVIISLVSGAIGGNVAGAAMPEKNPGALLNTIAGLIGGGLGDFILKAAGILSTASAMGAGNELDLTSILANIGVGGVSGGALTAIVALIKDAIQKK